MLTWHGKHPLKSLQTVHTVYNLTVIIWNTNTLIIMPFWKHSDNKSGMQSGVQKGIAKGS